MQPLNSLSAYSSIQNPSIFSCTTTSNKHENELYDVNKEIVLKLPPSDREFFFQEGVRIGLIRADGSWIRKGDLANVHPLSKEGTIFFLQELHRMRASFVFDFIFRELRPFSIWCIGSWVHWQLVKDPSYYPKTFSDLGLPWSQVSQKTLHYMLQKPSDMDARLYFGPVCDRKLVEHAIKIWQLLYDEYQSIESVGLILPNKEKLRVIYDEGNCFLPFIFYLFGEKIDLILISGELAKTSLWGRTNIGIEITPEIIRASQALSLASLKKSRPINLPEIKPRALSEDLEVRRSGEPPNNVVTSNFGVFHSLFLHLTRKNWTPTPYVTLQGSMTHLLSHLKEFSSNSWAMQKALVQNFFISFKGSMRETSVERLYENVRKRFPGQPAAYPFLCLSLCHLMEKHNIQEAEAISLALFSKLQLPSEWIETGIEKRAFFSIHELLRLYPSQKGIPLDALQAYLIILSGLLLDGIHLGQKSQLHPDSLSIEDEQFLFVGFLDEGVSLLLPSNFSKALWTLKEYFESSRGPCPEALEHLEALKILFYKGFPATFVQNQTNQRCLKGSSRAVKVFLQFDVLRSIGLALLFTDKDPSHFEQNFKEMMAVLSQEILAEERLMLFQRFLHNFKDTFPEDLLLKQQEHIEKCLLSFSQSQTTPRECLEIFCSLFMFSDDEIVISCVLKAWEAFYSFFLHEAVPLAKKILRQHMERTPPRFKSALDALKVFTQVLNYKDLESMLSGLFVQTTVKQQVPFENMTPAQRRAFHQSFSGKKRTDRKKIENPTSLLEEQKHSLLDFSPQKLGETPEAYFHRTLTLPRTLKDIALKILDKWKEEKADIFYLQLVDQLFDSRNFWQDALHIFEAVVKKNMFSGGSKKFVDLCFKACKKLFLESNYEGAFFYWQKTLHFGRDDEAVELLLEWQKILGNQHSDSLLGLCIQACTTKCGKKTDLFNALVSFAQQQSTSLHQEALIQAGDWLWDQLCLINPRQAKPYLSILQRIKENHSEVKKFLGSLCFIHSYAQDLQDKDAIAKQCLEQPLPDFNTIFHK